MKILYFTDTHDMGRNPGARIDDYHAAIMLKFTEAVETAIANNVDAVVHGGDWWHYPKIANSIYNQHQRLLRRLKKHKIKVYVVPGNHDLYGYSLTTLDQTSIGSLANAGLITLLTQKKSFLIVGANGEEIAIHGREYSADIDEDEVNDYQINTNRFPNADHHILFAHGMLLQRPFHPDVKCTLTKNVMTDADQVYTGHYHDGYPSHTIGDTTFHNIGSTGRDEGSVGMVKHEPKYAIIEATASDVITTPHVYHCAQKGDVVFDRTQLVQKKQHTRYLEAFEQTIEDAMTFDAFDPKDILAKTKGLSKAVLKEAMDAIVEQEKLVHDSKLDGFMTKAKAIGISSIELENFQSHKKTKVELNATGLNALTGASDSGKSAIIRAIRWVLYNDPKGTDFIRHGTTRATATVTFTDGSAISRSRTRSSAGEYIVRDTQGTETEYKGFGNNLPIEIANTHQMPRVELSTGIERSINFSYQLDGHFLLSESPAVRASTIGRLTGVHVVDAAIKEKSKDIRKITIDTNSGEKRILELEEQINVQFAHLPEKEREILLIRTLMDSAERLETKIEMLHELMDEYEDHTIEARSIKDELKQYKNVDKAQLSMQLAEQKMKDISTLQDLLDSSRKYTKQVSELKADLMDYDQVDKGNELLKEAVASYEHVHMLSQLLLSFDRERDAVEAIEEQLNDYGGVSEFENLEHLDTAEREIRQLRSLERQYKIESEQTKALENELKEAQKETEDIELSIQSLMKQMGNKCPTCNQSVDAHAIEDMLSHI